MQYHFNIVKIAIYYPPLLSFTVVSHNMQQFLQYIVHVILKMCSIIIPSPNLYLYITNPNITHVHT